MKRFGFIILALLALSSIVLIGYSKSNEVSVITEAIPESITRIEASGDYNGELEQWELTEAEIEELNTWVPQLSIKHRTYAEGETPNRVYNGGICYTFAINDGEMSFSWIYIVSRISSMMASGMKSRILKLHRLTWLGLANLVNERIRTRPSLVLLLY